MKIAWRMVDKEIEVFIDDLDNDIR